MDISDEYDDPEIIVDVVVYLLPEELKALREPVYGLCTACGAIEVRLNSPSGTRDFSGIGEAADYPTGFGCELCS